MKKILTILASFTLALGAFAQSSTEPNRLFVNDAIGTNRGFVVDRVSDITFGRVEGEVKAELTINSVEKSKLNVSVKRTPACQSFKIDVLPRSIAGMLTTPSAVINYIENYGSNKTYSEDFNNGEMTGIELVDGGDYTLVTVGIDQYGVQDGVCRENFTAPALPVEGNPQVQASLVEATRTSFSVKFVPNGDVSEYYTVAGEKGSLERQYEQFGPMFGFVNFSQMIMQWGIAKQGESTNTWKDMAPNTEYEIYIVACDKKGNPAPPQVFETSTLTLGGHGDATVAIQLGEYTLADWYGEQKPSQFLTFTPNDQAASYRFGVYPAEQYDANVSEIKENLCSEPPMPDMANWFFYEPLTTDFQIDPATEIVAVAAAKNIDGKWGEITEYRFTTPGEMPTNAPTPKAIANRLAPQQLPSSLMHQGKAPRLAAPARKMLIHK